MNLCDFDEAVLRLIDGYNVANLWTTVSDVLDDPALRTIQNRNLKKTEKLDL